MPANPKCFIHGTIVELCFRTELGLPFAPTPFVLAIIESILARAQTLYGFTLCHGVVMSNHPHLIGVVRNPADVPHFVEYIKRESSHAINSLNGTHGITLWCDGYDSPVVIDLERLIERIAYCYSNPQKANLVDRIEEYPNFSTWKAFQDGGAEIKTKRIRRNKIPTLPGAKLSVKEQQELAQELIDGGEGEYTLKIEPNAWMACLPDLEGVTPEEINAEIVKRVREWEEHYRNTRTGPVVGAHALRLQSTRQDHRPEKKGRRSICLSSIRYRRVTYIAWYKAHVSELNDEGTRPPGLFSPGGVLLANLNPDFVPLYCSE